MRGLGATEAFLRFAGWSSLLLPAMAAVRFCLRTAVLSSDARTGAIGTTSHMGGGVHGGSDSGLRARSVSGVREGGA